MFLALTNKRWASLSLGPYFPETTVAGFGCFFSFVLVLLGALVPPTVLALVYCLIACMHACMLVGLGLSIFLCFFVFYARVSLVIVVGAPDSFWELGSKDSSSYTL